MALGNGACDLIAGLIASGGEAEGGLSVSLGCYLGSSVLVTGFVCPMVIFFAKKDVQVLCLSNIHIDAPQNIPERYAIPSSMLPDAP